MKYNKLFENKSVSYLCFGTLSLSKLQNNDSNKNKIKLLNYAFENDINFYDTAELYDNYDILREFIKDKNREKIFISTKSYAYDTKTAEYSINKALKEMNTDYIDIFMLHEQDNGNNFIGHYEAVERLMKYKDQGIIKRFGISTHKVEAVKDSIKFKEIEVVFPIVNMIGIGIHDGTATEMADALELADKNGKFIFAMKPYGGGHLINDCKKALDYVKGIKSVSAIAIGMRTKEEIDANICYIENIELSHDLINKLRNENRTLSIDEWCVGCGKCVLKCKQKALEIKNKKCVVNMNKCVLCSYCAGECEDFYIKIV